MVKQNVKYGLYRLPMIRETIEEEGHPQRGLPGMRFKYITSLSREPLINIQP